MGKIQFNLFVLSALALLIAFSGISCREGCTDSAACNFDSKAKKDDGSCMYCGCTDPNASNFDPTATIDDNSCIYLPSGFSFIGEFSNSSGNNPTFLIESPNSSLLFGQGDISTELIGNKALINIERMNVYKDGNQVITSLLVNEQRNGTWVQDPTFLSSFEELTEVAVVLIIQRSSSGLEGDLVYDRIISYANRLLDLFLNSHPGTHFHVAIVDYGDNAQVAKPFSGEILDEITITDFKAAVNNIAHAPDEASSLNEAIITGAGLLKELPFQVDYKATFIIGDGKDNVSGDEVNSAIAYLTSNQLKDVFCIGVERNQAPAFPPDGDANFNLLAGKGNGFFKRVNLEAKVDEVFEHYYINVPNIYSLKYQRSGLTTSSPIKIQWNITGELKKAP